MKKTLKALFLSGISMLLCVSMLMGSTFAWFTDEVKSGNNVILAGNLDVEMYWSKDLTKNTWINAEDTNAEPVFNYEKWEPGYAEVRYVKIKNAGNLAFKYALSIIPDGEVSKLADVLDVYYVENATANIASRAALKEMTPNGTLRDAINGKIPVNGVILPEGKTAEKGEYVGETIIAIAIKMREEAGNEYKNLSIDSFSLKLSATQYDYENDSFGNDYDEGLTFPGIENFDVVIEAANDNGVVTADTTINGDNYSVTVLSGTKTVNGTLGLSVSEMENSQANVILGENEEMKSLDVHVEGLAEDNDVPVIINLGEVMPKGLNIGNYTLYHVENGTKVAMTPVSSVDALAAHNDFYYDPTTGFVTVAMASFSEVAMVAETNSAWKGKFDYTWYDASKTELTIANADQLAAFGAIVGGMAEGIEQDSFSGKTVKLVADINLGDVEKENNPNLIFYPIGYNSSDGKYEKTNVAVTTGFYNFCGTFDGNGNTIANFYHNTWEMKGDNNYYDATLQYYRDGMGLFGRVYGGTIKNLTVRNFSSDGEYTTTGVIAAYADGANFENIAIFNCNPRVYNIGNGGIVGCVGWYAKEANLKTTFTNITVDNSNKISALWGSYDVACGGIVGQYYPTSGQTSANKPANGGIHFENCHVSAIMDVYNDVCANYQYYAYRYTGMLIGSVRENVTIDGHVYPKMDGITAENCTVHFGTWNDYYYCEIIDNTTASYTHDYQMSRLTEIKAIDGTTITYLDGTTGTVPTSGRANYVIVDYSKGHGTENATCYHFKDGAVWTHDMGGIQTGVDENGDGQDDLKEDKQHIYLEFNNLVTGYGWGVTTKGVDDVEGVTILDREVADSVDKFKPEINNGTQYVTGETVTIGDLFAAINNADVALRPESIQVAVSPFGVDSTAGGMYVANTTDWTQGTLTFSGVGVAVITITDYYFCAPTTITVEIVGAEKFDTNFVNYKDYLYRVGNADKSTVALGTIFKHSGKGTINSANVSVEFETIGGNASGTYAANTTDWTKGTIQFTGTGVVKVTIKDDTSKEFVLNLEVVDAVNTTGATSATSSNVVLLSDCGLSSMTVSGRYAFYGNGFTMTYTGNGQYLNNGLKMGVVTVTENGVLDNVRIVSTIYPESYLYYSQVQNGPKSVEGDKIRYHYQLSAVVAAGNATIQNCYIYGGRTNVFVNTGNVTIKDTILECGNVANVQIDSTSDYTVTFENLTTIQHQVNPTMGDTSRVILGAGIAISPEAPSNPTIVLNGELKQYNWVTNADANAVYDSNAQTIIKAAVGQTAFNHTINGATASNLGIIYLNSKEAKITNNTGLPYELETISIVLTSEKGQAYSLVNASASQIYSDYANADRTTVNGLYQPQFKFDSDLGGHHIPDDGGDEFLYREGDTIKVMFPNGDTKTLDLATLVNIAKYSGQNLNLQVSGAGVADGKITLSTAGTYVITYTVTDTLFYDKNGNTDTKSVKYSWDVTIDVSLKDTKIPDAYFEFDTSKQKMGWFKSGSDIKQYLAFLSGLKIYDYNGQTPYLRFDSDKDFNKIASATRTGYEDTNGDGKNDLVYIEVKLTDGGVINLRFLPRANSGGDSGYTGEIKVKDNTLYFVTNKGTSNKETTTTAAYWYVDYYKFTGNNGVEITSSKQTFTSISSAGSNPSNSFSTTIKYTVTYDANSGNCGQTTGYATSVAAAVTLPTPTRSGYIFAGWYTAASGGTRVGGAGESYIPSANIKLYAQWGKPCTVTFDANGGSSDLTSFYYDGTEKLTLPAATNGSKILKGWYTAASGGIRVGTAGDEYNPSAEITLYAQWQDPATVTYNANGGTCGTASATFNGTELILPTPTQTGYTFNGWYTAASGGTKIGNAGAKYIPSANITLYAQWTQISYKITISTSEATVSGVTNGQTAHYGDTITFTVSFNKNDNQNVKVTDANGNSVNITGTYTFTMPASDVTISASSKECVTPDTLITLADGTQVRVDSLTGNELLLVWNMETGKLDKAPIMFVDSEEEAEFEVIKLHFSDGTEVKVIGEHGFWDYELNKYVYLDRYAEKYIGHTFAKQNGDSLEKVQLVDVVIETEVTTAWSPVTAGHLCYFVNGMLSMPGGIDGLFNIFEVDPETMTYDLEQMEKDIETYGLYTYEELNAICPLSEEMFNAAGGAYLKISIGKGNLTIDELIYMINRYSKFI